MGLSRSSALASNSTSTVLVAWFTETILKPRVWEPVGWFLVRRKRSRIASSVRVSGSSDATSTIRRGSLLPELVEGDDLRLAIGGRRLGIGVGRPGLSLGRLGVGGGGRLELQQELHARIVEPGHRGIGHRKPLRLAAELQGHREEGLAGRQVPILVLQDDGHLVRVLA